ncbi:unnamed protein product [Candida verbasci]|uniref:Uncharacterized protein n=1 Tax=Candida verbasci TaxID=1227364 RepID=A0A9W4XMG1_9ASCO|nr:unnamed protein product [Candida verbasci]
MVLLDDIVNRQQVFKNLTTTLPILDQLLLNVPLKNKIYDFQTTPTNNAVYLILNQLITSHLQNNPNHKVIIIDIVNKYPAGQLLAHPGFNEDFTERIIHYRLNTFAKIYYFFINNDIPQDSIVIIHEFHLMLELYKLEMSATYEELILKHHIEQNLTVIENKDKEDKVPIPQLPKNSDLLKMSPIVKYENHVNNIIHLINKRCINSNLMVFLHGYLTTKYRPYRLKPKPDQPINPYNQKGRVVLTPFQAHKMLTTKFLFYQDWLHKSPVFLQKQVSHKLQDSDLKLIYACQVENNNTIYNPIYYDFNYNTIIDLTKIQRESTNLPSSPNIYDTSVINLSVLDDDIISNSETE